MRKITQLAVEAFLNKKKFTRNNTKVVRREKLYDEKTELYLYDNLIAYEINDNIYISSCGWQTSTTRERLNGLLHTVDGGRVYISDGSMYYKTSQKLTFPLHDADYTEVK